MRRQPPTALLPRPTPLLLTHRPYPLAAAGGFTNRVRAVHAVVEAGVAVMGHVGLTPQAISVLGGFRPAAQNAVDALRVVKEAKVGGWVVG